MRILTCRGLIRCRSFASNSRFCRFAESKLILNSVLSFSGFTFLVVLLFRFVVLCYRTQSFSAFFFCRFVESFCRVDVACILSFC